MPQKMPGGFRCFAISPQAAAAADRQPAVGNSDTDERRGMAIQFTKHEAADDPLEDRAQDGSKIRTGFRRHS